jgi:hypothetical protein
MPKPERDDDALKWDNYGLMPVSDEECLCLASSLITWCSAQRVGIWIISAKEPNGLLYLKAVSMKDYIRDAFSTPDRG